MKQQRLGTNGPTTSALGLGCMSFGGFTGHTTPGDSLAAMDAAWDTGITFFDTADVYGPHTSEQIVGDWMASRGHRPILATKAGITRDSDRPANNNKAYLRDALEGSLKRLGTDHVDLFYIHRRDQSVPIEDLAGAMGDLINTDKIGGWGLSEVSPTTLRRAHAVTPVRAVQNEYSLWSRLPELGLIQDCEKLGVAFVPFSPLARGVFGRDIIDPAHADFGGFRQVMPRFQAPNWTHNHATATTFHAYAKLLGTNAAALSLAWLLAQGDHIFPIPGSRSADHINDWAAATMLDITPDIQAEINRILPIGWAWGDRYSAEQSILPERYA